ncbi:hypothetical protein [Okeania sp. SIO1F9]|uniref:hypothetical protein n=1 Tax=Okeania sp. SIO1F9 TaxID=2607813 RepID=UPI0014500167|nr:hypothetical protein [Okeania sp. SIO1F9]NET78194.1 hypothetical protein [Okeania sp. SIO1F9]
MKSQEESGVVEDVLRKIIPRLFCLYAYANTHFLSFIGQKPGTFDDFLDGFPSVTQEQVTELLEEIDISDKRGNREREVPIIDNLWIIIDFIFDFWRCLTGKQIISIVA